MPKGRPQNSQFEGIQVPQGGEFSYLCCSYLKWGAQGFLLMHPSCLSQRWACWRRSCCELEIWHLEIAGQNWISQSPRTLFCVFLMQTVSLTVKMVSTIARHSQRFHSVLSHGEGYVCGLTGAGFACSTVLLCSAAWCFLLLPGPERKAEMLVFLSVSLIFPFPSS